MQSIPIQQLPNQRLNVVLDGNRWDIGIRTTNGCVSVSLTLNGVEILTNMRAVAGTRIIPCKYQESGNFVFITQNYEIPDYTQFGLTQELLYFSQSEIDAVRDRPEKIITAADFDPNGGLPQAFAPKGYVLA